MFQALPPLTAYITKTIRDNLNVDHLEVQDLTGENSKFQALVVSSEFEGKSMVQQHQMVYKALAEGMREKIHALSLKTLTPKEWQS